VKRIIFPVKNHRGSVMAIVLMVMVTLTIVGLTAINDTVMETTIARNHRVHRETLYLGEAAVREATQIMEDYAGDPATRAIITNPTSFPSWLQVETFDFGDDVDWPNLDFRGDDGSAEYDVFQDAAIVNNNENACGFVVISEGVAPGGSLDMSDPNLLYEYAIYGRGVSPMYHDPSRATIKVGYRMRFW